MKARRRRSRARRGARCAQPPPAVVTWRLDNLPRAGSRCDRGHRRAGGGPDRDRSRRPVQRRVRRPADRRAIRSKGCRSSRSKCCSRRIADGPVEQRFLHVQEAAAENRALVELRLNGRPMGARFVPAPRRRAADAAGSVAARMPRATGTWRRPRSTARRMTHYVDGVEQGQRRGRVPPACAPAARRSAFVRIACRGSRAVSTPCASPRLRCRPTQFLTVPAAEIALWPEGVPARR